MAEYRTMKLTAKLRATRQIFTSQSSSELWPSQTLVAPNHQVLPLNSSSFEPDIVAVTTS